MGSIVRKLALFDNIDTQPICDQPNETKHIYNAPVQVFNGPVFFGGAPESFQRMFGKRSVDKGTDVPAPKRRLIQTKEETFFD